MDIISAYYELGSYRGAADRCGTTHRTVKKIIDRHEAEQAGEHDHPAVRGRAGAGRQAGRVQAVVDHPCVALQRRTGRGVEHGAVAGQRLVAHARRQRQRRGGGVGRAAGQVGDRAGDGPPGGGQRIVSAAVGRAQQGPQARPVAAGGLALARRKQQQHP